MAITAYSAADILIELLVQAGTLARVTAGQPVAEWPGYAAEEPDKPDNCVTLYDTDAGDNYREGISLKVGGPAGIQVRVRGTTHRVAYSKAQEVNDVLAQVVRRGVSIGTKYYLVTGCTDFGNLIPLGKDSPTSSRSIVVFNLYAGVTDRGA